MIFLTQRVFHPSASLHGVHVDDYNIKMGSGASYPVAHNSLQRPFWLVGLNRHLPIGSLARHDKGGQWCGPHSLCQGRLRVPPQSVPSYWIRVVARGVGCAVKYSTFPNLTEIKFGKTTVVSPGREMRWELPASKPERNGAAVSII